MSLNTTHIRNSEYGPRFLPYSLHILRIESYFKQKLQSWTGPILYAAGHAPYTQVGSSLPVLRLRWCTNLTVPVHVTRPVELIPLDLIPLTNAVRSTNQFSSSYDPPLTLVLFSSSEFQHPPPPPPQKQAVQDCVYKTWNLVCICIASKNYHRPKTTGECGIL